MEELSEDVLAKFLEETKAIQKREDEKAEIEEMPENLIVLDSKKAAKQRRENAKQKLEKLLERPEIKRVSCGTEFSKRRKTQTPSTTFDKR